MEHSIPGSCELKAMILCEYLSIYDFDEIYDTRRLLLLDKHPRLYHWQPDHMLKLGGTKYEMNLAHLAGDCAVSVLGEVVQDGKHLGFMMKKENPLIGECLASIVQKRRIMHMMKRVVDDLHTNQRIIHGDLKLANMLLCSDGRVRLCDFAGAFLIDDPNPPAPIYTAAWLSPYRSRHIQEPPTIDDDLFALGVSIWELFVGRRPFEGLKGIATAQLIRKGETIDITEIGDAEARSMVRELMSGMLMKSCKLEIVN